MNGLSEPDPDRPLFSCTESFRNRLLPGGTGLAPIGLRCSPKTLRGGDYCVNVFTYQTAFFSGTYRLGDVVDALKEYLRLDGVLNSELVIFVCHSMGGIVVRKYLCERTQDLSEQGTQIGLFLLASPSLGSEYANWLSGLARLMGHSQGDALRFGQANAWLRDLDKEFQNLLRVP